MSFLSLACRDRFRRKPVRERSSRSLLVRRRSSSTGSTRSCSRATRLSTEAHCRTERERENSNMQFRFFFFHLNAFICKVLKKLLTLLSPAVMFCSAPEAASRVVELISHWCSTRLYTPTIWGCHSHSIPLGTRATSAKVERSWFLLCQGEYNKAQLRWTVWSMHAKKLTLKSHVCVHFWLSCYEVKSNQWLHPFPSPDLWLVLQGASE